MALEKILKIEQAEAGESNGIKTLDRYSSEKDPKGKDLAFKEELETYGVKDIFADTQIRKDGEKYIFILKNANKFAIKENYLVPWIQQFYQDKKAEEIKETTEAMYIRLTEVEGEQTLEGIKWELTDFKSKIEKNLTQIERSTDIDNIKFKINRLISFFEQEKDLVSKETSGRIFNTKYDRKDKGLRNIQKTEIKRRLKQLYKMQDKIERLENNKDEKYTVERDDADGDMDVKMDDMNGYEMKQTLLVFSDKIEELAQEVPDFILSANAISKEEADTTPYYEFVLNNTKDATKLKLQLQTINNDYITLNKMALSADKREALAQDLERFKTYLEDYANNPNKELEPFVPQSGDAFNTLCDTDPRLQRFGKLNKKAWGTSKEDETKNPKGYTRTEDLWGSNTEPVETGTGTEETTEKDKKGTEYVPSDYSDAKEAFSKWGVGGVMNYRIDKTNMKPEQKQFWNGVGNLALTGWMIFVGRKMIKSAWNLLTGKHKGEDDKNKALRNKDRARLLGPTALVFGSQAWSGEWPMSLIKGGVLTEKITDLFTGKKSKDKKTNTTETTDSENEIITKYKSFPGATALFNGLTYGEMKQFLIQDGDRMKVDPDKYDELLDMFKTGSKKNTAAAEFLEDIGKDDDSNAIDLALTGMGVTRNDIQKESNKDKEFDKSASEAIVRLKSVEAFMDEKGYTTINPETHTLVDDYIANGKDLDELEDLADRGDVFYKTAEVTDQTGLKDKITTIAEGDAEKEKNLLLALNTFREKMPNASRKIDISGTRENLTFTTYDQKSTINLKNKELVGFTPSRFDSYYETIKAANLTNRIKFLCKDKEAQSEKPFYLSTIGKDITFDDEPIFSTAFDTEIMTAGRGGALKNVSPILEENKQAYCDYLNTLKFRKSSTTDVASWTATNATAGASK